MEGIRNILFDLGGVILNNDVGLTLRAFADLGISDMGNYFGAGKASSFFRDYETGRVSDAEFIAELRRMGNLSAPDSLIIKAWNALLLDFPPARIELIKKLREKYRVYLFSNTNTLHMKAFRQIFRDSFGGEELESLFDKAFYSAEIGLRKPDREAFEYVLGECGIRGNEMMLVDDALVNIEGAEQSGLQAIWVKPGTTILDIQWE